MYIQSVTLNACLRMRNTISLYQGGISGIFSSYKRWNIIRGVCHVLWITQHIDGVCVCVWCVCVCVCVWCV